MSKRRKESQKAIVPHRHCKECGISVRPDKEFCSVKCKETYENRVKKGQRMNYILLAVMFAVLFIVSFLPMLL